MRAPDYFDRADEDERDEPQGVTCSRCRAPGCYWQPTWGPDGKERAALYENGRKHECRANADDFEDVSR